MAAGAGPNSPTGPAVVCAILGKLACQLSVRPCRQTGTILRHAHRPCHSPTSRQAPWRRLEPPACCPLSACSPSPLRRRRRCRTQARRSRGCCTAPQASQRPRPGRCFCRPCATMPSGTPAATAWCGRRCLQPSMTATCPAGRPQGRDGPLIASRGFRQAVPELKATAEEVRVAGETVLGRLLLAGHFARFGGQGQPAASNATARFLQGDASTCLNA